MSGASASEIMLEEVVVKRGRPARTKVVKEVDWLSGLSEGLSGIELLGGGGGGERSVLSGIELLSGVVVGEKETKKKSGGVVSEEKKALALAVKEEKKVEVLLAKEK